MNKDFAIIIDNLLAAGEFQDLLRRKRFTNLEKNLLGFSSNAKPNLGDAFVLNFGKNQNTYKVEKNFMNMLANGYTPKKKLLEVIPPQRQIFSLMKNKNIILQLINDLLDTQQNERSVIELVVAKPEPRPITVTTVQVKVREKISIFDRFVKIGYKVYKRQYDFWSGNDYIEVDDNIYFIKTDKYGREYLTE